MNDMEEEMEEVTRGMHRRIYPYTTDVLQYANEREGGDPWIVKDRSTATRNERKGFGRALVRTWTPGGWNPVIGDPDELGITEVVADLMDKERIVEVAPVVRNDGTLQLELGLWDEGEVGDYVVLSDHTKIRRLAESLLAVASRMEGR